MLSIRRSVCIGLIVGASCVGGQAFAADTTFFAILDGGNEVSGTGQANAGDRNGYGSASLVFASNERLCFTIIVSDIGTPTAAHVHRGRAGVNGPIVIPLDPPNNGGLGASRGCLTIGAGLGSDIRNDPAKFYVNVHTGAFPGGAIRGQLF